MKISEELKIRVGDRFIYGKGKGIWEVMECLPGGVVSVMDRARHLQGQCYQHQIRRFLTEGSYVRAAQAEPKEKL